jgi:MoaA/NifB/PqqE/SkfB family radical SAM enzyme/SAM-dependent methyltransferase
MRIFDEKTVFFAPKTAQFEKNDIYFFVDGASPNWISTDGRGAFILSSIDGQTSVSDLVSLYARAYRLESSKALLHVSAFLNEALRSQMISLQPFQEPVYSGREFYLKGLTLKEFWIHTNNSCNLTCTHCLVSSSPSGDPGIPGDQIKKIIDETERLGVIRYYFTGGEPFVRTDIFDLIRYVTEVKGKELILLTNATLFNGSRLEELKTLSREKVRLQISLDGTRQEVNNPMRGEGTFLKIQEGARIAGDLGFDTSLTAAVTRENLKDLAHLPSLARLLGSKSVHLMWLHRRGRILEQGEKAFPTTKELFGLVKEVKKGCESEGVLFDQFESLKLRVNGRPGLKYDLGNACWESLCLYSDGHLYPSASFAGYSKLDMGNALDQSVESIWRKSPVSLRFRGATLAHKTALREEPFRFFTGGGDMEQSYFYTEGLTGEGNPEGEDPYYDLYLEMIKETLSDLAEGRKKLFNRKSGYNAPLIYQAMGEGAISCGSDAGAFELEKEVATLHSNCVLSFNVEKTREMVQSFYGKAAEEPQKELCCPVNYDAEDLSHIPEEVLERFYGCGSPMSLAMLKPGETVVDLGSGGGIDCFIAAKKTGPEGRVIGVDMTDSMLAVANRNKEPVAGNLGFDVVEFRKGYLESIPVEDQTVDLLTSNCVINLSPDKKKVFAEMWRVLKDHGRIVLSDIIAEDPVTARLALNPQLWGECISGSLTQDEFLAFLEQAGFYGLEILNKTFWKEVEGNPFYSLTVKGYKFEKKEGCNFVGQKGVYLGPFKGVMDEEGHFFPRNEMVEVCTDTAAKLKNEPYQASFLIIEPETIRMEVSASGRCLPAGEGESPCC